MTNALSKKDFDDIKHRTVTVISFKGEARTLTYGGLSYKKAVEHCLECTARGEVCLIASGNFIALTKHDGDDSLTAHLLKLNGGGN